MAEVSIRDLAEAVQERAPGDDPLVLLQTAIVVAGEANSAADELIERYVGAARAAGVSWTLIGERLGVSKQAARQRRVVGDGEAEQAVTGARRLATQRGRSQFRTEHLLSCVALDPGSSARRVLNDLGIDPAQVKKELQERVAPVQRRQRTLRPQHRMSPRRLAL